jgi:hypothetical protein
MNMTLRILFLNLMKMCIVTRHIHIQKHAFDNESYTHKIIYFVIAWDCINQHTIIRNNPNHEDRETTYTFGMSYGNILFLLCFSLVYYYCYFSKNEFHVLC